MKKLALTLCLLVVAGMAYSQDNYGTLEGTVLTSDSTPASDATIHAVELGRVVRTDQAGRFTIDNLVPGNHIIEITSPRWGGHLMEVEITAGETHTTEVTVLKTYDMEELVIRAGSLVRYRSAAVQPRNVLAREDLVEASSLTLGASLEGVPGITSTYFGPGAGRPIIRGLGGNRVSIMQQSIGVADVSDLSPDHSPAIETLLADRIEVIRGSATLLYGSSAVGGSVNILDGRVPTERPAGAISGMIVARGGTVSDERTAAAKLTGGMGKFAWRLQGVMRETQDMAVPTHVPEADEHDEDHDDDHDEDHDDDHDEDHDDDHDEDHDDHEEEVMDPISVIENTAASLGSGSFGLSWIGTNGYIGASISLHGTEYGIPGHEHGHHHEEEGEHHDEEDHDEHEEEHDDEHEEEGHEEGTKLQMAKSAFDLESEWRMSQSRISGIRAKLGYTAYGHDEVEDGAISTTYKNDKFQGRIEADHTLSSQTKGVIGLQFGLGKLDATGGEAFIPYTETSRIALFVLERYTVGAVGFEAGGRFEYASLDPDGVAESRNFSGLSLSSGVNLKQSEQLAVSLSVARSVKIPDTAELYAAGAHIGTGTYEFGDPNLKAESSISMDLSVHIEREPFELSTSFFSNRFRDFIFLRNTGEERDELPVYRVAQGSARFQGFEAEADLDLLQGDSRQLALHLWSDYTQATLRQNDEPLPRIPPLRVGGGLSFEQGQLLAKVSLKRVRSQHRVASFEEESDGYTTLDASLRYRLFVGMTVHNFTLRGSNLTDQLGRVHTSFLKHQIPIAGRDIRLTYQMTF